MTPAMAAFPSLAEPITVSTSKLTPEAIADAGLEDEEHAVLEPAGQHGVYELRFAPDGRASFTFGPPVRGSEPHVIWRRIGGYDVLERP